MEASVSAANNIMTKPSGDLMTFITLNFSSDTNKNTPNNAKSMMGWICLCAMSRMRMGYT